MDKDTLDDLKQFIVATVSQQLSLQTDEIRGDIGHLEHKIDSVEQHLSTKIDDLSNSVAEALDSSNEATAEHLKDHEQRLGKLENNNV